MGQINLLDCTLRDGGYINDWHFGEKAIKNIIKKLTLAGVEYLEIGFVKNLEYNPDFSLFPKNDNVSSVVLSKNENTKIVGMIDMGNPVSFEQLGHNDANGFDVLRVIFKKNKIQEAINYISELSQLGYEIFAQPVGTDQYTLDEFSELANKVNTLPIKAFYIVDSFGLIKKRQLMSLVEIADDNLRDDIMLGYHSHNNIQQAKENASALAESGIKRDICIDACVFGMGRGAGNLNMEVFAQYMNENFAKHYRIDPMLEIIDEYLNPIYRENFWGYSMPLYLSASNGCHPNYAIYFSKKGSLTVKSYDEILKSISKEDKALFSKEKAEYYYQKYQANYYNDSEMFEKLSDEILGRKVLLLGSGKSLSQQENNIKTFITKEHPIVISLNFIPNQFDVQYVFCCHMRRYNGMKNQRNFNHVKKIITSNLRDADEYDYMLNFSSYNPEEDELHENSGIMMLNILICIGVTKVYLAGMDGYEVHSTTNYIHSGLEYDFSDEDLICRNNYIKRDIQKKCKQIEICFITQSLYEVDV